VLLLTAGGLLYVLYRPMETLLIRLMGRIGMDACLDRWREAAAAVTPPEWVVYSLPAGLWAMSYVLIVDALTAGSKMTYKGRLAAVSIVPLLGMTSELLQAAGLVPGTFDWLDLGFYLLPLTLLSFDFRT
jgi:hypothetical protein